ncbi:hypothetical protein BCR34DRAFT_553845 [Clohesyomyces aquaticus]|uniref:Uncharacterized protein n=1 Tax=Clohesyomyces aquaticus TaxID=1231657 RepID=A0A1Y2A8B7_9PLEO|nr:hypothetical protein BCR34DRAFT_553845 [Clohesyomyces aquaticus]
MLLFIVSGDRRRPAPKEHALHPLASFEGCRAPCRRAELQGVVANDGRRKGLPVKL